MQTGGGHLMAQFSEQLEKYIKLRKITYTQVAEQVGKDRTLIHHLARGTRKPTSVELIEKLASVLMLSPEEYEEFFHLGQKARLGEEIYARRQAIQKMLLDISLPEAYPPLIVTGDKSASKLPHICESAAQVRVLLKTLIDQESTLPNGYIRFLGQPNQNFLLYLIQCASAVSSLSIQHILCLDHDPRASTTNIDNFSAIISSLFTIKNYEAFYFYGTLPTYHSYLSPFPILFLTSTCALQINIDYTAAIIHTGSAYRLLNSFFEQSLKHCQPLVYKIDALSQYVNAQSSFMDNIGAGKEDHFFVLVPDFCCTSFLDQEILNAHLIKNIPNREMLISAILNRGQDSLTGLFKCPNVQYYTKKGVLRFLNTGRFSECPDEFYTPFSPAFRTKILKRSIETAEKSELFQPRLYDHSTLPFLDTLSVTANTNRVAFCINNKTSQPNFVFLSLQEQSISFAISDYFSGLLEYPAVYSKADTLEWMKQALTQYCQENDLELP